MIQTIVTHECPKCGSLHLVKNGHDYKQIAHLVGKIPLGALVSDDQVPQQRRGQEKINRLHVPSQR